MYNKPIRTIDDIVDFEKVSLEKKLKMWFA